MGPAGTETGKDGRQRQRDAEGDSWLDVQEGGGEEGREIGYPSSREPAW